MWVAMAALVLVLIFLLFVASNTLNNAVMILIKQVWAIREFALLRLHGGERHAARWDFDALSVPGIKGELIIRRFLLMWEYLKTYAGYDTPQLSRLVERLADIDAQLARYALPLTTVTALTLKMTRDIFHGNNEEAVKITDNILARLRRL